MIWNNLNKSVNQSKAVFASWGDTMRQKHYQKLLRVLCLRLIALW